MKKGDSLNFFDPMEHAIILKKLFILVSHVKS